MVKLGEYDGLVLSYAAGSGIFGIRILQLDDLAASLQLARLGSDYTDSGVPVQAYTLSQVGAGACVRVRVRVRGLCVGCAVGPRLREVRVLAPNRRVSRG